MHADEVPIEPALVGRLLAAQFPQWATLPLVPVPSAGTDNALFRLGDELVVRLPRIAWAVGQAQKEAHWLPRLAPHLPLTIPTPVAGGNAGDDFPWPWSIYRWLDGETATRERLDDLDAAARTLAGFVGALQTIDAAGGPAAGAHNSERGMPLAVRNERVRACIAALAATIDTAAATRAWERALAAPVWEAPPVWVHGDLQPGNLLARDRRLCAVIDFGCLGVGDPACDLIVAWNLLDDRARAVYRSALAVDDATWERGRGWALSIALIALPYYEKTNPALVAASWNTLDAVLADGK